MYTELKKEVTSLLAKVCTELKKEVTSSLASNVVFAKPHHIFGLEGDIPDNAKDRISRRLKVNIFDNLNFFKTKGGPVGIYSLQKFPSTFARRNGCAKDNVNSRGRWRKHKGQVA